MTIKYIKHKNSTPKSTTYTLKKMQAIFISFSATSCCYCRNTVVIILLLAYEDASYNPYCQTAFLCLCLSAACAIGNVCTLQH